MIRDPLSVAEIYKRLTQAVAGKRGANYRQALLDELKTLGDEASTPGTRLNLLITK